MQRLIILIVLSTLLWAIPATAAWNVGAPSVRANGSKILMYVTLTSDAGASGTIDLFAGLSVADKMLINGKYIYKVIANPDADAPPAAVYTVVVQNALGETYTLTDCSVTLRQAKSGFDTSDSGLLMSIYGSLTASVTTLGNGGKTTLILEFI